MKKILLLFLLAAGTLSAAAQSAPALLVGSDPAVYATGGTSLVRTAGAFAVDNNAAAMSLSGGRFDVAATYGMWAPKTAANLMAGLGAFYRVNDRLAVGFSGRMLRDRPYDAAAVSGQVTGTFTPSDLVAGLGVSYAVMDGLSVGVAGRFLSSAIAANLKGSAFAADITAMYARDAFRAALGVSNIGSPLSYGSAKYALPMMARLGGAYSAAGFTAGFEADYLFSGALMAGLGLEYCLAEIVSLRGGFHYGDAAKAVPTYASLGVGVQYAGFHLDAAFMTASKTLGNTLTVSLGYAF
ncbi:MAG: PorV/PorQ family protein [Bacteroidales bacterium]|nr:PorV/PorQ family protein [Bacteroidales bacterium]